jgi:DNA-binding transcriptional ArsR family regulator
MRDLATIFRALADETRLEILSLLVTHRELCVCDLQQVLGIVQSKTSRHLQYLKRVGLLTDRRAGLWVHYRLAPDLDPARQAIVAMLRRLLANDRATALEERFRRWAVRKARAGAACRPSASPKPRAVREARR